MADTWTAQAEMFSAWEARRTVAAEWEKTHGPDGGGLGDQLVVNVKMRTANLRFIQAADRFCEAARKEQS